MVRKKYVTPAAEIFDFEIESVMLTPSLGVGPGDYEEEEYSNKRKPASSPWDSSNWSTKE